MRTPNKATRICGHPYIGLPANFMTPGAFKACRPRGHFETMKVWLGLGFRDVGLGAFWPKLALGVSGCWGLVLLIEDVGVKRFGV